MKVSGETQPWCQQECALKAAEKREVFQNSWQEVTVTGQYGQLENVISKRLIFPYFFLPKHSLQTLKKKCLVVPHCSCVLRAFLNELSLLSSMERKTKELETFICPHVILI